MENKVVIALDAMGGDYAPVETVKGAVEAVNENKGMKVILVGREEEIKSELAKYTYEEASIEIVNATEIIDMGEVPTKAIREKKDSSLVVAMEKRMRLYRQEVQVPFWLVDNLLLVESKESSVRHLHHFYLLKTDFLC